MTPATALALLRMVIDGPRQLVAVGEMRRSENQVYVYNAALTMYINPTMPPKCGKVIDISYRLPMVHYHTRYLWSSLYRQSVSNSYTQPNHHTQYLRPNGSPPARD